MFSDQRGTANISVLTAVLFIAVIFISGVYIGQEVKNFYRLNYLTSRAVLVVKQAKGSTSPAMVNSFLECLRAGHEIVQTNPPQCQSADDQIFVGESGNALAKANLIRLQSPRPYQKVTSPLIVEGEARGNWFFEASFPITVTDGAGLIIGRGLATAQSDWMTTDFVKFKATIKFDKPSVYNNGFLILKKDNPSGLAQNDDAVEIPLIFK